MLFDLELNPRLLASIGILLFPKLIFWHLCAGLSTISVDKSYFLYPEFDVCHERSSYIPRTARKKRCTFCYDGNLPSRQPSVSLVADDISFEAVSFQTRCREILMFLSDAVYCDSGFFARLSCV